jgi:hypothetical protein
MTPAEEQDREFAAFIRRHHGALDLEIGFEPDGIEVELRLGG